MKKIILVLFPIILCLPIFAQTNFRAITLDEAIEQAKQENKKVFIDFYTSWCGPCRYMATKLFPLPEMGDYFNKNFICIKMDAEKEGEKLAETYKVEAYPTFIVFDTQKSILFRKEGGENSASEFINCVEMAINPEKSPVMLQKRYEQGERTADLIQSLLLYKKSLRFKDKESYDKNQEEIKGVLEDYFSSLSTAQKLKAENGFIYSDYVNNLDDSKALFMIANRNAFDDSVKPIVNDKMAQLYKKEVISYLVNPSLYNRIKFEKLEKDINHLGLNEDKKYDGVFALIACRAKNDMDAYLKLTEKELPVLNSEFKGIFASAFGRTLDSTNKDCIKKATVLLRSMLKDMDLETMSKSIESLYALEHIIK